MLRKALTILASIGATFSPLFDTNADSDDEEALLAECTLN